jgi:hypothetical protein
MATNHPFAYKLCYQVPEFIWSHSLEVTDADGEKIESDPVTNALEELERLHYRDSMVPVTQGDFKHGWGILVLWQEDEKEWSSLETAPDWQNPDAEFMQRVPGIESIGRIDWLTPSEINKGQKLPSDLVGDEGWPDFYRLYYTPTDKVDIDAQRCILIRSRVLDRGYEGLPLIRPVWDTLVWSYAMFDSFGWATSKYGQTSITLPTQGTLSTSHTDDVATATTAWHKRGALHYNAQMGQAPEFVQPDVLDPSALLDMWLTNMAIGAGFPKLWFQGEKVGAVTGSEIDTRNTTARIKQLETQLESPIWRLAAVIDPSIVDVAREYRLEFPHEEQISEIERGTWWNTTGGAVGPLMQVLTVNEIRQDVLNKGPINGGDLTPEQRQQQMFEQEKELRKPSQIEFQMGGKKEGGRESKPKVKGESLSRIGVQTPPSYAEIEASMKRMGSVRGVCRDWRMSPQTFYRQRKRYKEETGRDATF